MEHPIEKENGFAAGDGHFSQGNNGSAAPRGFVLSVQDVYRILKMVEKMRGRYDSNDLRYLVLLRLLKIQTAVQLLPKDVAGNASKPITNGTAPATPEPTATPTSSQSTTPSSANSTARPPSAFTPNQLLQLKAQIFALKLLGKNKQLPANLLNAVKGNFAGMNTAALAAELSQQTQMATPAPMQPPAQPTAQVQPGAPQLQQPKPDPNALRAALAAQARPGLPFANPLASFAPTPSTTPIFNPSEIKVTKALPTPTPLPLAPPKPSNEWTMTESGRPLPPKLDPLHLMRERERRIKSRIIQRIEELKGLMPTLAPEAQRRAYIELKGLELLEMQRSIRMQVAEEIRKQAALDIASDRSVYKRPRRSARETVTETMDRQSRSDSAVRRQKKHKEFLAAVVAHHKEFKEYHTQNAAKMKKVTRQLIAYHVNLERREQQKREKAEKERLKALKDNNEDEYLRLLEQTKNERLMLLLRQTDEFLAKIGAMVQMEKDREAEETDKAEQEKKEKEAKEAEERAAMEIESQDLTEEQKQELIRQREEQKKKEEEEKKKEKKTDGAPKPPERSHKTYYTIAHSIQEEITEQPEMLVGGTLKEYQIAGLQWLVSLFNNKLNGILADEMGLGKTIQTISLVTYLMEKKGNHGPYLVIVPLSTLANWSLEFERWSPKVVVVHFKGQPYARKQIYQQQLVNAKFNVVLTTYEYIMKDRNMLSKIKWNYIIVDEGHRMKNSGCKLTTTLVQYYHAQHRLLLTGTPLQNSLPELWSLLNFLLPNIFNSVDNFEQWFNAPFAAAGEKVEMTEEEKLLIIDRLHKVLRPFLLRRLKSEVEHQLPDKVERVLRCDLSAMQKKMYKHMKDKGVMMVHPDATGGKGPGVKGLMNTLMQLRKICNHPYLFNEHEDWKVDENLIRYSGKFELIDRILPKLIAARHRVLIFSQMTTLMTILEDYLGMKGYRYLRLDGSTKAEDRGDLLAKFNAPESPYFVFILSTRAGGLGLNLQTADTVILFDSDWNPHIDLQAQDRVHRIGQKAEVRVFRLITANSIEERILERAQYKLSIDAKIIQAGMFNNKSNAEDRREMLQTLMREDNEEDDLEDIPTAEQMNKMIARGDHEVVMFQQMDREREQKEEEEWRSKGGKGPKPPRLVTDKELPDWLQDDDILEKADLCTTYGRGLRERRQISYDDGLSEKQWTKIIEKGEDVQSYLARKKKKNKDGKKDKHKDKDKHDDKHSGRPRKSLPSSGSGSGSSPKIQKKCEEIWSVIRKATDAEGRVLSSLFLHLPNKKEYPDYYKVIKSPIDLTKIKNTKYRSANDFEKDFTLLFNNAREYNMPDSQVVADADALEAIFKTEFDKAFADLDVLSESEEEEEKPKKGRPRKSAPPALRTAHKTRRDLDEDDDDNKSDDKSDDESDGSSSDDGDDDDDDAGSAMEEEDDAPAKKRKPTRK